MNSCHPLCFCYRPPHAIMLSEQHMPFFLTLWFAEHCQAREKPPPAPACTYQAVFCYILVSLYFVGDTPVDALKHLLKYFGSANPQA